MALWWKWRLVVGKATEEATANTHVATDIAEVIAFAVSRPQHVALNEILVRPTAQAL